ncbi:FAD-binding domain-containing protein [Auricularia subglabra TFB-10046 SS5]|nr:FAD-binding domain-containing protein [Auricularia subglabra TFB-10046 SS5]
MDPIIILLGLLSFALASPTFESACAAIATAFSSSASAVHWPNSSDYELAIEHWLASSTERAACVAQPATTADVGAILKVVGIKHVPFAVKGGGHTSNRGFSSTTGVHISLARFNYTRLDDTKSTAVVGAGSRWSDVYAALDGTGVNLVGGRNPAVGVAGFTLGGGKPGYSWKSNQYGLAIDTLTGVNIVLPNGTLAAANQSHNQDLFFSLKGGFNNYGVVTELIFRTVPQDKVWAGRINYATNQLPLLTAAIARFERENVDPRAAIVAGIAALPNVTSGILNPATGNLQLFYDGPNPPASVFSEFLAIPAMSNTWGGPMSFLQWVGGDGGVSNLRGIFNAFSTLRHTESFLQDVVHSVDTYSARLGRKSAAYLSVAIEPFLPTALLQANSSSSAYPPVRSPVLLPSNIFFGYTDAAQDHEFRAAIADMGSDLVARARGEGLILPADKGGSIYPNYALAGADSMAEFYGAEHLARMRRVRREVDPDGIMELTGGWKL